MKTQISRNAHRPDQDYTGVYQQQGRMITDADWNALTDIEKQKLAAALLDAIASGAPREGGLAINGDGTVQPGDLYVDGLRARLAGSAPVAVDGQVDYPNPPSFSGKNVRLYADVWERTVTALEDRELMDSALHGADTTTRSQMMLQVKWCSLGKNPQDPADNPPLGTGKLALKLRKIFVGDDPCDPCASEVDLDERIGNYLFRVEVHDVYRQSGNRFVVLKWSRDNGAEAYPVDNIPTGFNQGDWVWEFFDSASEKMLGHHFPGNFKPRRGELRTDWAVPGGSLPKDFVRQWDGYAVINLDTEALVEGEDRGTELNPGASPDAHGFIGFDSGTLTINGERLEMRLGYGGQAFVAGDFWQAPVREAEDAPGDYVLGTDTDGEGPQGIRHHYLVLGELDNTGALVPQTDAERRQFNFPPLTDIRAADVGFTDNCPGLFHGAENVQAALDELCSIGAEDIAYTPPDCPDSIRANLASALTNWADLDDDGKVSVKDMLDALLCHLNGATLPYTVPNCGVTGEATIRRLLDLTPGVHSAGDALDALLCDTKATHIPLDKSQPICPDLDGADVVSVQDALAVLCARDTGGGCAVSVEPGELEATVKTLVEQGFEHLNLCLKAGEHVIDDQLGIDVPGQLRITGAGSQATVIRFMHQEGEISSESLILTDLAMTWGDNVVGQLRLRTRDLFMQRCLIWRSADNAPPMLDVDGTSNAIAINCQDNRLVSVGAPCMELHGPVTIGYFQRNYCLGDLIFNNDIGKPVDPDGISSADMSGEYASGTGALSLIGNYFQRWVTWIESGLVRSGNLEQTLKGLERINASQNFFGDRSSLIAEKMTAEGNQFAATPTTDTQVTALYLFANRLVANGNLADNQSQEVKYAALQSAVGSNLVFFNQL